ncbi:MAG TPA: hypothetical protein VEA41_02145 [Salinarimonas sp.]|nr:hypothetical protein [Salinarimonas sp.]
MSRPWWGRLPLLFCRSHAFLVASDAAKVAWLELLIYCNEHNNKGVLEPFDPATSRPFLAKLGVSSEGFESALRLGLLRLDGATLKVSGYLGPEGLGGRPRKNATDNQEETGLPSVLETDAKPVLREEKRIEEKRSEEIQIQIPATAAPSRSRSKGKGPEKPKIELRPLIAQFCDLWKVEYGRSYQVMDGEPAALGRLISLGTKPEDLPHLWAQYLRDKDQFVTKVNHSLRCFCTSAANRYSLGPPVKAPQASMYRDWVPPEKRSPNGTVTK